jgi:hypothetical protein
VVPRFFGDTVAFVRVEMEEGGDGFLLGHDRGGV